MSKCKKIDNVGLNTIYDSHRLCLIKSRKTLKMSGEDAGALLGISQSAFSRLESGKSEFTLRQYLLLSKAYRSRYYDEDNCDAED